MGFLKNYIQTFKKITFYSKYMDYGFDEYIKTFQNTYKANNSLWNDNILALKKNLDDDSLNNLSRFLDIILNLPLPSKNYLVRKDALFNKEDLKIIKLENDFAKKSQQYYKKYNLQGFEKIEFAIFKYHCGLIFLPKQILLKLHGTTFIDAGAFWGDSALMLNKYYSPNTLVCLEPNSINFNNLEFTIRNNNLNNKTNIMKVGLSNNSSYETMNYISQKQNHGASLVFKPKKNKTETVSLLSLDQIVQENNIYNVGLLKLDVEGYGLKAIEGAKETIKTYKPIISCAVYHNPEELLYIKPFLEKINPNYKFKFVALSQKFILKELTLLAY